MNAPVALRALIAALITCAVPRAGFGQACQRYLEECFSSYVKTSNLTYAPEGGTDTILDIYEPAGDTLPARPAIVWGHGGNGNKDQSQHVNMSIGYAKRGFVVANINYRTPGYYFSEPDVLVSQHDMQAAVRWLRGNAATYRVDTSKIVAGGGSRGAVTSLSVNFNSEDPGTVGDYDSYPSNVYAAISASGNIVNYSLINSGEPPINMYHSTNDPQVPYSGAVQTCDTTRNANNVCIFYKRDGSVHGLVNNFGPEIRECSSHFIYYHVIESGPPPPPPAACGNEFELVPGPAPTPVTPTPPGATNTATPTPTSAPPTATPTHTPTAGGGPINTGFRSCTANAAVTSGSGDNNGFQLNSANACADGGGFAEDTDSGTTQVIACNDAGKDRHLFHNFGFAIPSGATINGIEVRLDAWTDAGTQTRQMCVELSWDGGVAWTTSKTTPTIGTTEATFVVGSSSDTWGRTWSAEDFSTAAFRVRVTNIAGNNNRDFRLDWIPVQVTYTP